MPETKLPTIIKVSMQKALKIGRERSEKSILAAESAKKSRKNDMN